MKRISMILLLLLVSVGLSQSIHENYSKLLGKYVENGLLDYQGICGEESFDLYIQNLAKSEPDMLTDENEKLAFWINAYNAYTIKVICENYPVESIRDIPNDGKLVKNLTGDTVWDKEFVVIDKKGISLNHIEHDIIRKKFNDPRIHFALVCAAMSCPPLRNEAYTGARLNEQLDDQGRTFLNNKKFNEFNLKDRKAFLSKIFDWYGKDFGDSRAGMLLAIAKYLPEKIADDIRSAPDKWNIEYKEYDWSLNKTGK